MKIKDVKVSPALANDLTNRIGNCLSLGADPSQSTLYLVGEIEDELAYRFLVGLHVLESTGLPIKIVMCSPGGSDSAGCAIYDAIRLAKSHVTIDGYGCVQSIAALILQAADRRRLSPETRFMIHNGSINMNGGVDANTMVSIGKEIEHNNLRYSRILADRSGKSLSEIRALCNEETYYSATEAVDFGFADEVISLVPQSKKVRK